MKFSRTSFLCLFVLLVGFVQATLFSDILRGIFGANRFSGVVDRVGQNVINDLESNEDEAGTFICEILNGDIPTAFEDLGEDVIADVTSDFDALTDFVKSLPSLVPEIWMDIEQDGEDVINVIGELITDPAEGINLIINGVETVILNVFSGISSIGSEIISGIECLFGNCPVSTNAAQASLSSACSQIMSNPVVPSQMTTVTPFTSTLPPAVPAPGVTTDAPSTTVFDTPFGVPTTTAPTYIVGQTYTTDNSIFVEGTDGSLRYCYTGSQLCPASLNYGCCPMNDICGLTDCTPTSTPTQMLTTRSPSATLAPNPRTSSRRSSSALSTSAVSNNENTPSGAPVARRQDINIACVVVGSFVFGFFLLIL